MSLASRAGWKAWRVLPLVLLLSALPLVWRDSPISLAWFDASQKVFPRQPHTLPAVIVGIDEASLARKGQWPWPRTQLAGLVERIGAAHPAAIGLDLLFPEEDRYSPRQVAPFLPGLSRDMAARLDTLPGNDETLAATLGKYPTVLGVAGLDAPPPVARPSGPSTPAVMAGGAPQGLRAYPYALRSIPALDQAAAGHAMLSVDPEDGLVRRVPLATQLAGQPMPALPVELLRVASGEHAFRLTSAGGGLQSVGVGDVDIPTDPDGRFWVYFSPRLAERFISAADVLDGKVDPSVLEGRLVLVGVTGLGMVDYVATPAGGRMPGVEVHAQVLENIFDSQFLRRPAWGGWAGAGATLLLGLVAAWSAFAWPPRRAAAVFLLLAALPLGASLAAFRYGLWLLDGAMPALSLVLVFGVSLTLALTETRRRLQDEREAAARLAGEMDAARRIQTGMLPRAENAFPGETRLELHAFMEPAKTVGGDLYDFFMLDRDRLFFMIGDVAGKGLPASLFMAMSKTLCRSVATRHGGEVAGTALAFNTEISRDNPEMLFVTGIIGVLDLRDGTLDYCNAGHDAPYRLTASGELLHLTGSGDGPPFSVIEGFPYAANRLTLTPGDSLVLVTDGITEAANPAGELFGGKRLRQSLAGAAGASPTALCQALQADVAAFQGNAGAADDMTMVVLRWRGGV